MKAIGLSRDGCQAILVLSAVTLLLIDVAKHSFAPTWETAPFFALISLCLVRLFWRSRKASE